MKSVLASHKDLKTVSIVHTIYVKQIKSFGLDIPAQMLWSMPLGV